MQIQPQFSGRPIREFLPQRLQRQDKHAPKHRATKQKIASTSREQDNPMRKGVKMVRNTLTGLAASSALLCAGAAGTLIADNIAEDHGHDILTSWSAEWNGIGAFALGLYGTPLFGVPAAAVALGERLTRKKDDATDDSATPASPTPVVPSATEPHESE